MAGGAFGGERLTFRARKEVTDMATTLYDVREQAKTFIKSTLGTEGKVVKVKKVSDGWEVEVETAEEDNYYKKINPDYRIVERRLYAIKFDENLEAISYEQKEGEKEESA
ncbi:MAG: hypothetical protein Q8N98_03115 [bacterium]|nr:hypothetical protein [bacterium]